ncbi:MAG: ATP-dependent Clp protease proteolytic subunit [Puniceicoccales bacterium]|jgi:ATP-dependent Clp protease protease subunit|nr:ATP-dependent Clp protease proteolytic subunit [Puniceicoccales bacterium]
MESGEEDDGEDGEGCRRCGDGARAERRVQEKLLQERRVFLWGAVDEHSAKDVVEKLVYLDLSGPGQPITLHINTPGGCITSGMAIYDTIQLIASPVTVLVMGMAASMGSIILSAPAKGRRFLYPGARVIIHQPLISGKIYAPAVDINIQAEEMERTREEMNQILARASGQPLEKIRRDTDRDFYMNAQEAIAYGLADAIIHSIVPPGQDSPGQDSPGQDS